MRALGEKLSLMNPKVEPNGRCFLLNVNYYGLKVSLVIFADLFIFKAIVPK